jgi:replicative superfamily II helicase
MVAEAFNSGVLKVIVATCSLAAGINLPARRVILNGARMGRDLIGPAMLRQMRGRAGRKGKDEIGETYLCCQKSDLDAVADLLQAELPPVESCLTLDKRGVKRALLEVIGIRLANSREAITDFIKRSLLYETLAHTEVLAVMDAAMESLLETRLVEKTNYGALEPTRLGQAIVVASLTPEDGIFIHSEMRRALEAFVMDGEMHVFYMFTPVHAAANISWPVFRDELERLDDSGMRAFRHVGVNPSVVNRLVTSGANLKESTLEESNIARIYRRAYCASNCATCATKFPSTTSASNTMYLVARSRIWPKHVMASQLE